MTIPMTSIDAVSTSAMRDGANQMSDTPLAVVAGRVLEQGKAFQAAVEQFQQAMAEFDEVGVAVATSATLPLGESASRPVPTDVPLGEAASRPVPTDAPLGEAASRPVPTDVPLGEAMSRPVPTDVPLGEAASLRFTEATDAPLGEAASRPVPTDAPLGEAASLRFTEATDVPLGEAASRRFTGTTDVPSAEVAPSAPLPLRGDGDIAVDTHDREEAETPVVLQAAPLAITPTIQAVDAQNVAVEPVQVVAARVAHRVVATPAQVLIEAAAAVADTIVVSPGLLRGSGEIQVQLRPDVLEGTVIHISTTAPGALAVQFTPTTENMAALLEKCAPQLVTYLSERVHNFQVAVNVKRDDKLKG